MAEYNLLTLAFAVLIILPLITGFVRPFSRERVQHSIGSLFDNIEFLLGTLLSIYLAKRIFFENGSGVFKRIYEWIPETVKSFLYGKDVLTYIIVVPLLLFFILIVLRLITSPLYNVIIVPLADRIHLRVSNTKSGIRRLIGALWQLPKAVYLTLVFALLINFFTYYFYTPVLSQWMNESGVYKFIYKNALNPVLNSNIAKRIPVIVNDSFRDVLGEVIPTEGGSVAQQIGDKITSGLNIKVIEYFNGVTLDEAVKSTNEINDMALKITAGENNDKGKAYKIYKWISKNIEYDFDKADQISKNPRGIQSGAQIAFETRRGICFDYSSLFIAMCRSVGLKVRLVTGLAYSGLAWGDHAWNQVFISDEDRWVNVDTTFGSVANYFDKPDFNVDHRYAEVQGEWLDQM